MSTPHPSSTELYRRLLSYVRPHAKVFAAAVLGMILAAATEPLFPAFMKPLLDGGFARGADPILPPLAFAAAIVGVFVLRGVFTFFSHFGMQWVSHRVILDLRKGMFERLVRFPTAYYDEHSSGVMMSKVTYDVTNVTAAATSVLTIVLRDTVVVCGLLGWLFYLNWKMTFIALIVAPAMAYVVKLTARRLRAMSRETQRSMGEVTHVLEESIECHKVIKVYGGQGYESRRFESAVQRLRRFFMRLVVPEALATPASNSLAAVAVALIVYIALQESAANRATVGEFVSFLTAMLMLIAPVKRLTEVNAPLQRGLAAAESVFGIIDTPIEEDRGTVKLGRARGDIVYEQVSFTYPTRNEPALDGVDLHVRPGETVALVGGSGGGKTTLVNLLPRFYAPQAGRILLDGHDLQELTLESLRANIALVSQEVVLFNDTIAANIAYGRQGEASEADLIAAAEAAHAMEFIRECPQGLETQIGEKGLRLSGGQRQRLAIARALLKDAPLLILDEATSALDSESERHVQAALETLMQGRTTLVIAHRLSTIEHADRIVVLERGRIVEIGKHAELLARDGVYAKLYRIQYATQRAAA
ncbi:MAG: lipid A export permease/ATP-binding protein MsbA [bacterium]